MAFKLTKAEATRKAAIVEAIRQTFDDYSEAMSDAQEFCNEIRDRLQEEYDDKSEGWQDGERGQAAAAMIEAWDVDCNVAEEEASGAIDEAPAELDI